LPVSITLDAGLAVKVVFRMLIRKLTS